VRWRGGLSGTTHVYGSKTAENRRRTLEDRLHQNSKLRLLQKKEKPARRLDLTVPSHGSHAWVAMQVQTKFLRLFREVAVGDRIDGCNKSPTGCVNARAIM
jgi:hypothetical protein